MGSKNSDLFLIPVEKLLTNINIVVDSGINVVDYPAPAAAGADPLQLRHRRARLLYMPQQPG